MFPPQLPLDSVYTNCWCEENVYLLCRTFIDSFEIAQAWDVFAVFISNHTKTVALWNQKLSTEEDLPVVWDYHVVLLLRPRDQIVQRLDERARAWIYDFDSRLPNPCTLKDYLTRTFNLGIASQYQSMFRVIPGETYLDNFASDRSHMLSTSPSADSSELLYVRPPPLYRPLCGRVAAERNVANNLMSGFVCMKSSEDTYGDVVEIEVLSNWC